MQVCGLTFTNATVSRIQSAIGKAPSLSRRELSRRVCRWLRWRSPDGRLRDMQCRKALAAMNRRGLLNLPDPAKTFAFTRAEGKGSPCARIKPEIAKVECRLSELGTVSVEPVSSRYAKASKIWFALMDRYHYLGSGPLCGAQIRYLVKSSRHGYLGALAFSSASWALRERDRHIGWTEAARRANLPRVVTNDRFLILPAVRVKNLASHVLSLVLSRLRQDWGKRYEVSPVLVETFVDPSRFKGTCYKAANWTSVGQSAGRRDGKPKAIYVYPLCEDWRQTLCLEPVIGLGETPRPQKPAHWAEEEFGTARLYDNRLKQRLYTIAQDFYSRPQATIPEACGAKARTMGAYRFFQNKKATLDVMLTAHTEATLERIQAHRVVLAPQDTTTLSYRAHPLTEGLGPINHVDHSALGLILHDTVAFSEEGTPLGVVDAQCWARDLNDKGKHRRRHKLSIDQKESRKWLRSFRKVAQIQKRCPQTMLVSIGDRESDLYDLFWEAAQDPHGPKLLVRAGKARARKAEQGPLWDVLSRKRAAGSLKIHIPRRASRPARDAWVDIRFAKVTLTPPRQLKGKPVTVWAVYVSEQKPNDNVAEPVEWMLLTTAEVKSFAAAKKRVEWYTGRWGIEVYHRTLKSGCRIKDRQLGKADRLESCLGIDMVVAWRIYHLMMLGRETPNLPCTAFFKDVEWKALCCYANETPIPPKQPPTLAQATRMVATIGGHLGRKGDGPPGAQTLWRGLTHLDGATTMYAILTERHYASPFATGP